MAILGPRPQALFRALLLLSGVTCSSILQPIAVAYPRGLDPVQAPLAQVRFIHNGLTVRPSAGHTEQGVIRMALHNRYGLQTAARQFASIGFRDGTVLHLNERTDAVLRSARNTFVAAGVVDEELVPGTDHQITTAAATASAIGTGFLVMIIDRGTYFMVRHGAVLVTNAFGSVVVKRNQGSLVIPGHAPQPAYPVDASAVGAWTDAIPPANIEHNLALDADGGRVVDYTSQFAGVTPDPYSNIVGQPASPALFINDGRLDRGWETAPGDTSNQAVTIKLPGSRLPRIDAVLIDPAAPPGLPSNEDLKNFSILVSTGGTRLEEFRPVVSGTCRRQATLQRFGFQATRARYVKLVALDNYGSADRLAVTELEVIGR